MSTEVLPHLVLTAKPNRARIDERQMQSPYPKDRIPHSDPCPRCAVRGELGCEHRLPFAPIHLVVTTQMSLVKQTTYYEDGGAL